MLRNLVLLSFLVCSCSAIAAPELAMSIEGFRDHHVPASFQAEPFQLHGSLRSRQAKDVKQALSGEDVTYDPTDDERILMARIHHEWRGQNQGRHLQETTIQIPVYIHVMLPERNALEVTDAQTTRFMNTLNKGFSASPFRFVLYGTSKTYNNTYAICREEAAFKTETRAMTDQDGTDVLHMWICDTNADYPNSIGYTYFPPITRVSARALDGIGKYDFIAIRHWCVQMNR